MKTIDRYIIVYCFINFIQALITPIIQDEAYYWMFSKHLDLGYFDHPPLVAYMIKMGTMIMPSPVLGIRFLTVVMMGFTLKTVWNLIPTIKRQIPKAELIFFGIAMSLPLFHVYSFLTTPDVPLLFFTALFLLALKRITEKESIANMLLFGAAAALLVYSKYHGGIVILLAVLFRLDLLKRWSTYASGLIALILVIPHLYWQIQNDFITFDFHLFQRASGKYSLKYVDDYLLGTLAILNPAFLFLIFKNTKLLLSLNNHSKFLLRMLVGIIGVFLFMSLRSRIEAHWVAVGIIPITVLMFELIVEKTSLLKPLKIIAIIFVSLIILARVVILFELPVKTEFYKDKKEFFQSVSELANGKPVVYINSYQKASKHYYYTGFEAISDNNAFYRKSQYDLFEVEKEFNNRPVLVISDLPAAHLDSIEFDSGRMVHYKFLDNYVVCAKLKAQVLDDQLDKLDRKGTAKVAIYNPYNYPIHLNAVDDRFDFGLMLLDGYNKTHIPVSYSGTKVLPPNTTSTIDIEWSIKDSLKTGDYGMLITVRHGIIAPKAISKKYKIHLN